MSLVVIALALFASPARAVGVPAPSTSTLPDCLVTCPMGDLPFAVVVRDLAGTPIPGASVVINFANCPFAYPCPNVASDPYVVDQNARTLTGVTDANGMIEFHPRVGGSGPAGSVRVFANNVLMKSYALASPDQNGDGVVLDSPYADDLLMMYGIGPSTDLDCNGQSDAADRAFFYLHLLHSCNGVVVPSQRATWGELKLLYR